nr:immunoglobulin heavy chain junction region [Mus musculus]
CARGDYDYDNYAMDYW